MSQPSVSLLTLLLTVGVVPTHAAELISVKKIWGAADSGMPHQAFTDLLRFKGHWYLGLREALKHHGGLAGKGRLRVLRSADGEAWESAGVFELAEGDLRDAKLSITDRGELMLNSAIQVYYPDPVKHKNFAWFSSDGESWSEPVQFGEPDYWIWSVTWHDGVAYGVGYPTTRKAKTRLYKSEDGRSWEVLVSEFYRGNESAIAFKSDGTAVCLMRSGKAIGQAKAPYTQWTWKKTVNLGGPDLLRLSDGRFVTGGRHGGWGTMKLFEIDPDTGRTALLVNLPARGDSGYPGLVYHDDLLWVSYYSSADDATDGGRYLVPCEIRLAKVKLGKTSALPPPAKPVNIRLSAEDDAGTTAIDQATDDGRQDAKLLNGTRITTEHAAVGSRSYAFGTSPPSPDLIDLPGTSNLGSTFTLAAFVKTRSTAPQRLFSSFHGTSRRGEVILDLDTDNNTRRLEGLRFYVGSVGAVVRGLPAAATDGRFHHYAVTYDDGKVQLYFDGRPLGDPATLSAAGPLELASDLRVGEDRAANMTNEVFVGYLDEILIADHAMTPEALATMVATTAKLSPRTPETRFPLEIYDHDPATEVGDIIFGDLVSDLEHDQPGRCSHGGPVALQYTNGDIVTFYANTSDHNLDGWSEYARSRDGCKTWERYIPLAYTREAYEADPEEPAWVEEGVVTQSGTAVLFVTHFKAKKRALNVVLRSRDNGKTWTAPEALHETITGYPCASAVVADTSYLLLDSNDGEHVLFASADDGVRWELRSTLPLDPAVWYGAMCAMADGRLLAGGYLTKDEHHFYYCISEDGGRTWTEQRRSPVAKKIRDPELAYWNGHYILHGRSGNRGQGRSRFVLYRSDDGETWDSGTIINSNPGHPDGYSHNCVLRKNSSQQPDVLMILYSIVYAGNDTNEYVFFVREADAASDRPQRE